MKVMNKINEIDIVLINKLDEKYKRELFFDKKKKQALNYVLYATRIKSSSTFSLID